jgi:hypothetical protein
MKVNSFLFILFTIIISSESANAQYQTYKKEIEKFRSDNWKALIQDPRTTLQSGDSIYLAYYRVKEKNKVYRRNTS